MTAHGSNTHSGGISRANLPAARGQADPAQPVLLERLHAAALRRVHGLTETAAAFVGGRDGTRGKHELATLSIDSPNRDAGVHFVSTPWAVLDWVHAALLPDDEKHAWTFVDLGAGKGRAVLSAAKKPYGRVLGVEFAAELAAAARSNVTAAGHGAPRVSIVEGDAATCELPRGPLAVFLFNPFGPPVIDDVVARLAAHRQAQGQVQRQGLDQRAGIKVAYLNPVHAESFSRHGCFRPRSLPHGLRARFALASPYRLALFDAD